jgi:hypothetical protein
MFRLLGVILIPSIEPNQDYLITSALRDPLALTIGGITAVWNYSQVSKMIGSVLVTADVMMGFGHDAETSSCHA